uniref:peroxidase n=1 Tax=Cannabis sativa TaxID=3483 RepID=A0A803Q3B6_CANSA
MPSHGGEDLPRVVSCADILAITSKRRIANDSGPSWDVKLGRRDSTTLANLENKKDLPLFTATLDNLITYLKKALMPRHGCSIVLPYNWTSPKNLIQKKGLLESDQVLFSGGSTDAIVTEYSKSPKTFRADFASAMIKMGDIQPLTGRGVRPGTGSGVLRLTGNSPSPRPSTVATLGGTGKRGATLATRDSRRLVTGTSRPRVGKDQPLLKRWVPKEWPGEEIRGSSSLGNKGKSLLNLERKTSDYTPSLELLKLDSRSEPLVSVDPCRGKETVGIVPNLCEKFPITIGPNVGSNIGPDSGIVPGLIGEKVLMSCDVGTMARMDNGILLMGSGVNVDRAESSIDVVGSLVSCGSSLYSTNVGVNKNGINNCLISQKINSLPPSFYDGSSMGPVGVVEAEPILGEDRALSLFFKAQEKLLYDLKHFGKMVLFEIKNIGGDIGVLPTSETNERTTPFKMRKFEGSASLCSRPHKIIRTHPGVIRDFPWDKKDQDQDSKVAFEDPSEDSSSSLNCNDGIMKNPLVGSFVMEDSDSSLSVHSHTPVEENVKSPPQEP